MNGWRELLARERPGNGRKSLGARDDQLRNSLAQLDLLLGTLELPPERLRLLVNGIGAAGAERKLAVADTLALPLAEPQLGIDDWLAWDRRALGRLSRTGVPRALARRRGAYAPRRAASRRDVRARPSFAVQALVARRRPSRASRSRRGRGGAAVAKRLGAVSGLVPPRVERALVGEQVNLGNRRGPLRQRLRFFVTSKLPDANLVLLVSHIGRQDA
jgi:hypothetical protein